MQGAEERYFAMSDFVAPKGHEDFIGARSWYPPAAARDAAVPAGMFAVSAGFGIEAQLERFEKCVARPAARSPA